MTSKFIKSLQDRLNPASARLPEEELLLDVVGQISDASDSVEGLGERLAPQVGRLIPFDRLTLAFVDMNKGAFAEAYSSGLALPGPPAGHDRSLAGTVLEQAAASRSGVVVQGEPPELMASRYADLRPAIESGLRSMVAVPLLTNDEVVGALTVASMLPNAYQTRQVELGQIIAARIAGAVASLRVEHGRHREATTLKGLVAVGLALGSSSDVAEVFEEVASAVRELVPFDRLEVATLDPGSDQGTLIHATGAETPGRALGGTFPISGSVAESTLRTGAGVLEVGEPAGRLTARYPSEAPGLSAGLISMMAVPMALRGQVFGCLTFRSATPGAYSSAELELATQVVAHVAGPFARSEISANLRREAEQRSALAEIGRSVAATSDPGEAFEGLSDRMEPLLDLDHAVVALLDEERQTATNIYGHGLVPWAWDLGTAHDMDSAAFQALTGDEAGIIATSEAVEDLAANFPHWPSITAAGVHSIVAAPVVQGEAVLGALALFSTQTNAYGQAELALTRRIASQIAGAVAATRGQESTADDTHNARALAEIAQLCASVADIAGASDELAIMVRELVPCDTLEIAALSAQDKTLTPISLSGAGATGNGAEAQPLQGTMAEEAVRQGSPLLYHAPLPDEDEPKFPSLKPMVDGGLRSFVAAPLRLGSEFVGVVTLASAEVAAYSDHHLKTVGGRIVPIRPGHSGPAARSTSARARGGAGLRELARLIGSATDITDAYDGLAKQLPAVAPLDRIEIATIDLEQRTISRSYVSGVEVPGAEEGSSEPLADTTMEEAIRLGLAQVLQGTSLNDPVARSHSLATAIDTGLQSFVVTPLISGGQAVGALSLASAKPLAYGERETALIERVGLHLATAIAAQERVEDRTPGRDETGRLEVEEPESAVDAELAVQPQEDGELPVDVESATPDQEDASLVDADVKALNELSQIATSSIDFGEVLDTLARKALSLVPFDRMVIWTVDLQRTNLVASYAWGAEAPGEQVGFTFPLSSPAGREAQTEHSGAGDAEEGLAALAERFPDLLQEDAPGTPGLLLAPLVSAGETVGMLSLRSAAKDAYTRRDAELVEKVAAQLAGSVANAQVYLECQRVEEAIREAVERMELAVTGSGAGLWDWKVRENEVWWSPRTREMLGEVRGGPAGAAQEWMDRLHPEDRDRVHSALEDHLSGKAPYDLQYRLRGHPGQYQWFHDRGQAIWDEGGTAVRMSGSLLDVTEAREAGDGAYIAPNHIRAPMALVESFRRALLSPQSSDGDDDQVGYVSSVAAAGRQMSRIVDDLDILAWVNDVELEKAPVDVTAMARSILRKMRKAHPDRKVTFSVASGMTVDGDERLVRVMMENLLDNAWKFTGKHAKARMTVGAAQQEGEQVYHVRDDGAGFDSAHADRVFELFQRLHSPAEFEGTGVGLSIVRHAVRRHGGRVWAEGRPERGATVYFTLG